MGFLPVVIECSSSGELTFSDQEETVLHTQPHTRLLIGLDNHSIGTGTVYITTKRVLWLNDATPSTGYQVDYHELLMHAMSRGDEEGFTQPSIYCQLEQPEDGMSEDEDDDDDDDEQETPTEDETLTTDPVSKVLKASEARLVPDDAAAGQLTLTTPSY